MILVLMLPIISWQETIAKWTHGECGSHYASYSCFSLANPWGILGPGSPYVPLAVKPSTNKLVYPLVINDRNGNSNNN